MPAPGKLDSDAEWDNDVEAPLTPRSEKGVGLGHLSLEVREDRVGCCACMFWLCCCCLCCSRTKERGREHGHGAPTTKWECCPLGCRTSTKLVVMGVLMVITIVGAVLIVFQSVLGILSAELSTQHFQSMSFYMSAVLDKNAAGNTCPLFLRVLKLGVDLLVCIPILGMEIGCCRPESDPSACPLCGLACIFRHCGKHGDRTRRFSTIARGFFYIYVGVSTECIDVTLGLAKVGSKIGLTPAYQQMIRHWFVIAPLVFIFAGFVYILTCGSDFHHILYRAHVHRWAKKKLYEE